MTLVVGTNCGFVESRPTGDPDLTSTYLPNNAIAMQDISDSGAFKVTELGFYVSYAYNIPYDIGIYTDSGGEPDALVDSIYGTANNGWNYKSVDISINGSTTYWLAIAFGDFDVLLRYTSSGGNNRIDEGTGNNLPEPFVVDSSDNELYAIYAVWEAEGPSSYSFTVKDTLTISDSLTKSVIVSFQVEDTLTLSDIPTIIKSPSRRIQQIEDTLTLSESISFTRYTPETKFDIEDTLTLSESATFIRYSPQDLFAVEDTLTLNETKLFIRTSRPDEFVVGDTLTLSDSITFKRQIKQFTITPSDSLSLGESINFLRYSSQDLFSIGDSLSLSDSLSLIRYSPQDLFSISDSLTLSDSSSFIRYSLEDLFSISDSLTLSEVANFVRYSPQDLFSILDNLNLSEDISFVRNVVSRTLTISDSLTLSETASIVKGGIIPTSIYTIKSLAKALTLSVGSSDFIIKTYPSINPIKFAGSPLIIKYINPTDLVIKEAQ